MESAELDEAYAQFTTTVGLITTDGPKGPNVMSAEWTFHVSYDPFLIAVHLAPGEATHENIEATKEFGVNLVSEDQVVAMGFAGHFSKHGTDKLSSTWFETFPAKKIQAPMIRGCLLNAECRLVEQVTMGDHTAFVGEVVAFSLDRSKKPVVLHRGPRYLGSRIKRPRTLAVAATPSRVAPGTTITVEGEFTALERGAEIVVITLLDSDGVELAREATKADDEGTFHAKLPVPSEARSGEHVVVARHGETEARARLQVAQALARM